MLDLNQVFLFCEVVKAGCFAQAAQRLRMPANSVSRKIQQLETDLGSRLIHRSTRKLTLTTVGQAFFERCASPVADLAHAGQESLEGSKLPGGLVRVAAPTNFFDVFRLEWVADFLARHTEVRLEFVLDDAKTDLIAASIDVAYRAAHLEEDTHFGLVASPTYQSARGTPSHPDALANHDCIPQSNLSGLVSWHLHGPEGPTRIEVSGTFRANAASAARSTTLAGLG